MTDDDIFFELDNATTIQQKLEWLRKLFATFVEPPCIIEDVERLPEHLRPLAPGSTDKQISQRRFVLACLALGIEDSVISACVPGFNCDLLGIRPQHIPQVSFALRPYHFDELPKEFLAEEQKRFKQYLSQEMAVAKQKFTAMKLRRPRPHRKRQFDLALRYFVTVRQKLLKHPYAEIAMDHVRPKPTTEKQLKAAENRLKAAVRVVTRAVGLPVS